MDKIAAVAFQALDDVVHQAPDGALLLRRVESFLRRFVAFKDAHQSAACALWVLHSWAFDASHQTGYLAISSPEPQSGKSRLLEVLELLVAEPWLIVRPSEAVVFRNIERKRPTLLLDEYDAIFNDRSDHEGLRAIFNAGHRPGAIVPRAVGEGGKYVIKDFAVYCPKALAGLGDLPDTVASRSITIALQRRTKAEHVERFRRRLLEPEAAELRSTLEAWATHAIPRLRDREPEIPEEISDRQGDCWEASFAIADDARAEWPDRARAAAIHLAGSRASDESLGELLLTHLREVFGDADRLATEAILRELVDLEEGPWPSWWGEQVAKDQIKSPASRLARLLKPYGIRPHKVREGEGTFRGYRRVDLAEVWDRYLPPSSPEKTEHGSSRLGNPPSDLRCSVVPSVPSGGKEPGTETVLTPQQVVAAFNAEIVPPEIVEQVESVRRWNGRHS